jgi:nucleolar pre-ribosomal-associated protein 1
MVNHPKFRTTFAGSTSDKLASFVSALFNKHPTNTCQTSHIAPLIHVFKGTSSLADRKLMSIFSLFEKERKVSVTYLLSEWQADSTASSETPSPITILCSLNPSTVFQSCLMLSNRRTLENASTEQAAKEDGESRTYDCNLILLLVASALSSDAPPSKHLVWVELFRSNVFVVALRSLSLKDRSLRKLGYLILAATWKALKVMRNDLCYDSSLFIVYRTSSFKKSRMSYTS